MRKIYYFLILIILNTWSCKSEKDKIPKSVSFLNFVIFDIPAVNPDGGPWDEDNSAADIIVVTTSPEGWSSILNEERENVTSSSVSIGAKQITVVTFGSDDLRTIGIYDKDSGPDEAICIYDWRVNTKAEETNYSNILVFSKEGCPTLQVEIMYYYL